MECREDDQAHSRGIGLAGVYQVQQTRFEDEGGKEDRACR
jgi:hypothetical protein